MKKHTTRHYQNYKIFQEWNDTKAQDNVREYVIQNKKTITQIVKENVGFNITFSKVENEYYPLVDNGNNFAGVVIEFNVSKANQKALEEFENQYLDSNFIYESCLFAWEEIAPAIASYSATNLLYKHNGKLYLQIDFSIIEEKEVFIDEDNNVYFETEYGDIAELGYEQGGVFKFKKPKLWL